MVRIVIDLLKEWRRGVSVVGKQEVDGWRFDFDEDVVRPIDGVRSWTESFGELLAF